MSRLRWSRDCLEEGWADLDEEELAETIPADTLQLIESANAWARAAGTELRAAAPGALRGALKGFMVGGPAGAAVGAAVGGVGSRIDGPPSGAVSHNPAAAQLLATLIRPEMMQALGAMMLGNAGTPTIPVVGTQVPVSAFVNLLTTLATQAAAQQHSVTPPMAGVPRYLAALPDPTSPIARADALLSLLADAEEADADAEEHSDSWPDAESIWRDLHDIDRLEGE